MKTLSDSALQQSLATPRPIVVVATDQPDGSDLAEHWHRHGQLIHAISGVMIVRTARGDWVVPIGRAVWVPPLMKHSIGTVGDVRMRTVFVAEDARPGLPPDCRAIEVSLLLRELILHAVRIPPAYALEGRDQRVMELILDEIQSAPVLSLHLPMPQHARTARLCTRLIQNPAAPATLEGWAGELHMNSRTFARLFKRETGMTFGAWCRHTRLLLSLPRLAQGDPILEVALDHGYDSPSAFAAVFRKTFGVSPSAYFRQT
ncbi:helix-turn-helix transcriptional regulator [Cupriavidus basilensis]|uniref:Helix-turn-helix transcriptional regulator n=1 Tax=Cupriavidus basilensis TaxID=68895 RepID=A0ABT6AKZ2_9BURK|nr:helix-turn-helix transcriptional regulator [Cupriavidus basilensis]MDF3833083.1 helix-turn-helix transcriptional regulator [Cupriavidus basilensis]